MGHITELKVCTYGIAVQFFDKSRMSEYGFQFGGKDEYLPGMIIEKRFDTGTVAATKELIIFCIMNHEGKHADTLID